jgi:hypothetical protein
MEIAFCVPMAKVTGHLCLEQLPERSTIVEVQDVRSDLVLRGEKQVGSTVLALFCGTRSRNCLGEFENRHSAVSKHQSAAA